MKLHFNKNINKELIKRLFKIIRDQIPREPPVTVWPIANVGLLTGVSPQVSCQVTGLRVGRETAVHWTAVAARVGRHGKYLYVIRRYLVNISVIGHHFLSIVHN